MLRQGLLAVGVLSAVAILVACRGEGPPPAGTSSPQQQAVPSPASQAATPTPAAVPSTAPPPTSVAVAASPPTQAVPVRLVDTPVPPALAGHSPVPTGTSPTLTTNVQGSPEDVAAIHQIVKAYWGAFNSYDADHALAMLEPAYRATEEELIRKDIGRVKLFRVKLDVSEESPPTLNANGDYVTYLTLGTPIDSRRIQMVFRNIDGQWWIIFSDEVE